MSPLVSLPEYETFVYGLQQQFSVIQRTTLVVVRRGEAIVVVNGTIEFPQGFRLIVREQLNFAQTPGLIKGYGYEVWQNNRQLYWYDSQPHPNNPALASTDPHHKHIPPDIKHNRIPAPNMSFTQPNLPALIEEITQLLTSKES